MKLVATLVVVVRILQHLAPSEPLIEYALQLGEAFITRQAGAKLTELLQLVSASYKPMLLLASGYVKETNANHPLVYSNLELGQSWEEVVFKMLNI